MIDYNKFYLVSFDVAKALKDLQYSEETLHHYLYDGNEAKAISFGSPKKSLKIKNYETFNAPTQGYLIRELRDKYKILVITEPLKSNTFEGVRYGFSIFDLNPNLGKNDWVLVDYFTDSKKYYERQEDAIDAGLIEGLTILKRRGIVWE